MLEAARAWIMDESPDDGSSRRTDGQSLGRRTYERVVGHRHAWAEFGQLEPVGFRNGWLGRGSSLAAKIEGMGEG